MVLVTVPQDARLSTWYMYGKEKKADEKVDQHIKRSKSKN